MKAHSLVLLLCAVFNLAAGPALSLSVTPVQLEFSSAGTASRGTIVVTNDSARPLPIELSVRRLSQEGDGGRIYSAGGEEDFLLLPPQALIAPGGSQVFRVQWVGEPMLAESQSYMIFVSQVPVKMPSAKGPAVQVVFNIGCMVNVAPPRGLPALEVTGAAVETDRSGRRYPVITVRNPSRVHALLPQSTIRLSGAGWSRSLPPAELGSKIGIGLVQPGRQRTFVLPVELPHTVTRVEASIDFKPTRP